MKLIMKQYSFTRTLKLEETSKIQTTFMIVVDSFFCCGNGEGTWFSFMIDESRPPLARTPLLSLKRKKKIDLVSGKSFFTC